MSNHYGSSESTPDLDHIEATLDRIEDAVDRIAAALEQLGSMPKVIVLPAGSQVSDAILFEDVDGLGPQGDKG